MHIRFTIAQSLASVIAKDYPTLLEGDNMTRDDYMCELGNAVQLAIEDIGQTHNEDAFSYAYELADAMLGFHLDSED